MTIKMIYYYRKSLIPIIPFIGIVKKKVKITLLHVEKCLVNPTS